MLEVCISHAGGAYQSCWRCVSVMLEVHISHAGGGYQSCWRCVSVHAWMQRSRIGGEGIVNCHASPPPPRLRVSRTHAHTHLDVVTYLWCRRVGKGRAAGVGVLMELIEAGGHWGGGGGHQGSVRGGVQLVLGYSWNS